MSPCSRMCVCASIRPGSSVMSPRSIVRASAGTEPPIDSMLLPRTTIRAGETTFPPRPSIMRAARRATTFSAANAGHAMSARTSRRFMGRDSSSAVILSGSEGSQRSFAVEACPERSRGAAQDDELLLDCTQVMRFSVEEYVRWEDIDAAGIINYQAYLRFFGLAEVELFRSCGLSYRRLFDELEHWLQRMHVECDFCHLVTLEYLLIVAAYCG